jgi:hypothetical protein
MTDRVQASRDIAAPVEAVFAVMCDPRGHVEIDASGMLQWSEDPPVTAAGDTFVVHMDREALGDRPMGKYDATNTVTAFERDRLIEWTPSVEHGYVFGYEIEPMEGGAKVTSYCDWSRRAADGLPTEGLPLIDEKTLRASLGILARTVEQPSTRRTHVRP